MWMLLLLLGLLLRPALPHKSPNDRPWLDATLPIPQRVALLMKEMTLEEKMLQLVMATLGDGPPPAGRHDWNETAKVIALGGWGATAASYGGRQCCSLHTSVCPPAPATLSIDRHHTLCLPLCPLALRLPPPHSHGLSLQVPKAAAATCRVPSAGCAPCSRPSSLRRGWAFR